MACAPNQSGTGVAGAWVLQPSARFIPGPFYMQHTADYTVIILRTPHGYTAVAPAFPTIRAQGLGARTAYARLKVEIKRALRASMAPGAPIPRDPVVQTRTLRLDLWHLSMQEDLQ